jgi:hypothetical protein
MVPFHSTALGREQIHSQPDHTVAEEPETTFATIRDKPVPIYSHRLS